MGTICLRMAAAEVPAGPPSISVPEGRVRVVDVGGGVRIPCEIVGDGGDGKNLAMIVGHGLGSKNPAKKHRRNDVFTPFAMSGALAAGARAIWYDARGHGGTTGWEAAAEAGDLSQFKWEKLADDMVAIADAYGIEKFIACGSSMGGATSLWAAVKYPDRVLAVIMLRPPTAWESRKARRHVLVDKAAKMRADAAAAGRPRPPHAATLMGAADGDLPADNELVKVRCPVLLLCHGGDAAHPLSTARLLQERLPDCRMAAEAADAAAVPAAGWPEAVRTFLTERVVPSAAR